MTAVKKDLYIEQGATFILPFQWCLPGATAGTPGSPRNLTGYIFRMQIRKNQQETALITASGGTGGNGKIIVGWDPNTPATDPTITPAGTPDPTNGWVTIFLTDDDTDQITAKSAKYDLEAEDTTGKVFRLLQGSVTTDPNYTQESTDPIVGA